MGAGCCGALTARELAVALPGADVEIVDKDRAPAGASAYAGAIDAPYAWDDTVAELGRAAWDWHETVAWARPVARYRAPLRLAWLGRGEDGEQLADVVRAPVRDERVPAGYDATRCVSSEAHVIDPPALIRAALDDARARGVTVSLGRRVCTVERRHRDQLVRFADGGSVRARHVVASVGPWIRHPELVGFRPGRTVRVKRVHGLRVETSAPLGRTRGWSDPDRGLFLFPRLGDRLWAMSVKHAVWDVDPDRPQPTEPAIVERAAGLLDATLGRGRWRIDSTPTFADSYPSLWQPVVEPVAEGLGTVITGTHGSGVRLAPALAQRAVALVAQALSEHTSQVTV